MRSLKLFYLFGFAFLLLYLVAEFNRPKNVNWAPTLSYNDKIPFGTFILFNEIKQLFPGAKIIETNKTLYDQFHNDTVHNSNYLIIAGSINLSKYDYREMINYIKNGNSVFIATDNFAQKGIRTNLVADTLGLEFDSYFQKAVTQLNFTNDKLAKKGGYRFDRGMAASYFEQFDTTRAVILSKNEDNFPTLVRYNFGKGSLFLCADPKLFSNYSLLTPNGADYAAKALSYLPEHPVIYWDHLQNGDIEVDESPLRVFFSYPALQWAYYIALFTLVGFILFEMKRRQRIIPIIAAPANSTVDFVSVVGRVYYEQRNNTNIAQKKILYFLEHLRTTYYLKTNVLDREFIEKLAQKTGVDKAFVQELIAHIQYLTGQRVSDEDLIKLNQLIEQFYIKSR